MLKPPNSILVIVTRRIGDVLLATPLIRSLRLAWPSAAIDALVFAGTEGILAANRDLRRVVCVPENAKDPSHLKILCSLFRRYDLTVSTLPGDRPTFTAWLAGRRRVGLLLEGSKHFWKRLLLSRWAPFDERDTHTVLMNLTLADLLGIARHNDVTVSWSPADEERAECLLPFIRTEPYALLHLYPKYRYKMWHRDGWRDVSRWLDERGLRVVLTGGGDPEELAYVEEISRAMPAGTVNLSGRLTLGGAGFLISRARVYVGPDTVATHMAAALGVPTVALYGPTNPVKWGPWPHGYGGSQNPYARRGSRKVNNVTLLQGPGDCVPCHEEGCDRHIGSDSDCLLRLPTSSVIKALEDVLSPGQDFVHEEHDPGLDSTPEGDS
ncbi:MAG: glycosyltransferase family 9 protein [Syntrophales bacterium]